jgi:hypothetical protein
MSTTPLSNALAFIESDVEVTLIPVVIGALGILQKNPNALGLAAAESYVLANAPAALLSAETTTVNAAIGSLNTKLQALLASAQATIAADTKAA